MSYKTLCGLFGNTRQAYYKRLNFAEESLATEEIILGAVNRIRIRASTHRWGARKLKDLVNEELLPMGIRVGRDHLFDLLRENGMLVRRRKRKFFTTQSHHWLHKYDNLIQDMELTDANQLWVADITYVKSQGHVYYLYLITDAYSQKIVGWHLSKDLRASSAVAALKMALRANQDITGKLIHHSDRGVQYCSEQYVKILKRHQIDISMTKPGSPQQNAIAERINGILKEEWLYDAAFENLKQGKNAIKKIISVYNSYRPHNSLGNKTPEQIHDLGFSRHQAVRVIGKTYTYRKRTACVDHPLESNNAYGQTIIPRAVAPQQSCLPLDRCTAKKVIADENTNKSY
ncbi:MAG: IS3 family transposase [Cryomorphaceae bacterium]|nr:MAG: IS3 family transposase [Cryomorphaceae bacterium]